MFSFFPQIFPEFVCFLCFCILFSFVGPEKLPNPGSHFPTPTARCSKTNPRASREIFSSFSFFPGLPLPCGKPCQLNVPTDPGFHFPTPTARCNNEMCLRAGYSYFFLVFRCLVASRTLISFQIPPTQASIPQRRRTMEHHLFPCASRGMYIFISFLAFRCLGASQTMFFSVRFARISSPREALGIAVLFLFLDLRPPRLKTQIIIFVATLRASRCA